MILKPYQEDRGEEGVYDHRNKINNLSGKQWLFSTRSVITKDFPNFYIQKSMNAAGFYDYLPVLLIRDLIRTFTKPKALIIDPLCQIGSSGYASFLSSENRRYFGFSWNELLVQRIAIENKKLNLLLSPKKLNAINFYNNSLLNPDFELNVNEIDFIFTELIFTSNSQHNQQIQFKKWQLQLKIIFSYLFEALPKEKTYAAIAVKNVKVADSTGIPHYYYNSNEIANMLIKIGWILKAELIWKMNHIKNSADVLNLTVLDENLINQKINDKRILIFRIG